MPRAGSRPSAARPTRPLQTAPCLIHDAPDPRASVPTRLCPLGLLRSKSIQDCGRRRVEGGERRPLYRRGRSGARDIEQGVVGKGRRVKGGDRSERGRVVLERASEGGYGTGRGGGAGVCAFFVEGEEGGAGLSTMGGGGRAERRVRASSGVGRCWVGRLIERRRGRDGRARRTCASSWPGPPRPRS